MPFQDLLPKRKAKFLSNKKSSKKPSVKTHGTRAPLRSAPSRPISTKKGPAPQPAKRAPAPPPPVQSIAGNVPNKTQSTGNLPNQSQGCWVEALYPFTGEMSCDISFQKSDRIEVLTKTSMEFDWWEGRFNGKVGIFPANYVKVVS